MSATTSAGRPRLAMVPNRRVDEAGRLRLADFACGVVLAGLALTLYAWLAVRLAQGQYLDFYNLAFDFDPVRTVDALASTPPDFLNVKHPLFVLLRPLAWPLLAAGYTAKESAALVLAGFGSATVALCYVFLRKAPAERPVAVALTLLFIVSGAQLFTAIIAETYGVAAFSIVLTWCIAQARLDDPHRFRRLRYAAAVLTFGTTLTNVMQSFIAEMLVGWHWFGLWQAVRRCVVFGLILAVPIVILAASVWFSVLVVELRDPVLALKHIWWQQTKGPTTGPLQVLVTFFGFSFVSPEYSWLMLPEGINMRDFRDWSFGPVGAVTAPLWLVFCAVGTVAGLAHPRYRPLAAGLGVALVGNLVFHLGFQFRGSLYLYAAHMHFLVFALGAGLAPWMALRTLAGKLYLTCVLMLALLVAANNLPIARTFVADFDAVHLDCASPCADRVGQ
jgi:hypothetical protein